MKIGLSTYSLSRAIKAEQIDVIEAIQWIADNGGEHVEIVPGSFILTDNDPLVKAIVAKAKAINLEISSYTIGAQFIQTTEAELEAEITRVKKEVDIANALGVKLMRHDAASRPAEQTSLEQFEADLPIISNACAQIADYAKQYGITTSVENHGLHLQAHERVQRLLRAVNRDNFKTTLDIGNFICVDENAFIAVKQNLKYASMVHAKDFHLKDGTYNPGEGWAQTPGGNYRRGAIVGNGDIKANQIIKFIKESGYNGFLSVEFEGMEDCFVGSRIGMENVKKFWNA
ncbi:MAG: sugar phosphate isomerase/epimerase [Victivallaceae bacterium]|nr:sugar phosphate isomerase/epimerase [Victivallaceae bacterium]